MISNYTIESIKDKRVLFFAPAFFGYESKIKEKMEQMGAIVDYYDVRSVSKAFDRALLKISTSIFIKKTKKYYDSILDFNRNKEYDYVFFVKCDMVTKEILTKFRKIYPNAIFCLYLWDSIENIPGITKKFKYFDRVLSFDRQDVMKNPVMKFRPLFYTDEFRKELKLDNFYKYDISFCGTIHSDRYAIIKKVKKMCNQIQIRFYTFSFLQGKFIYKFYKVIKKEFRDTSEADFSFSKISGQEISNVVDESRVILDIQHPNQTGLTMRTIEMIGMNKKLITTNADIKEYDFYIPVNILVIDRKKIEIPEEFIKSRYIPLENDIYEKYSIESWIKDILLDNQGEMEGISCNSSRSSGL